MALPSALAQLAHLSFAALVDRAQAPIGQAELPGSRVHGAGQGGDKLSILFPPGSSQTATVRSPPAAASRFPSGLNATLVTGFPCRFSVIVSMPAFRSVDEKGTQLFSI